MRGKLLALWTWMCMMHLKSGQGLLELFGRIDRRLETEVAGYAMHFTGRDKAQLGLQTVLAGLVVVIAATLAVIVVDKFDSSLGTPADSNLSSAQNDILSGFADMASLIGPLLLVGIAAVIIFQIRRVT